MKQDNNGTTFVISEEPIDWLLEYANHHTETGRRSIGPWRHTTRTDAVDAAPADLPGDDSDPWAAPIP